MTGTILKNYILINPKRLRRLGPLFFGPNRGLREENGRDGFFWFLLFMNIVLMAALGVMVYGAVVKTYF